VGFESILVLLSKGFEGVLKFAALLLENAVLGDNGLELFGKSEVFEFDSFELLVVLGFYLKATGFVFLSF